MNLDPNCSFSSGFSKPLELASNFINILKDWNKECPTEEVNSPQKDCRGCVKTPIKIYLTENDYSIRESKLFQQSVGRMNPVINMHSLVFLKILLLQLVLSELLMTKTLKDSLCRALKKC